MKIWISSLQIKVLLYTLKRTQTKYFRILRTFKHGWNTFCYNDEQEKLLFFPQSKRRKKWLE